MRLDHGTTDVDYGRGKMLKFTVYGPKLSGLKNKLGINGCSFNSEKWNRSNVNAEENVDVDHVCEKRT